MIIAVVGAGGKTTRVHKLAAKYREMGKRVLVTTTTHMLQEPGCILEEDETAIVKELDQKGYCMAGLAAPNAKMGAFSETFFDSIQQKADIVIVEADGSKGLPVKIPLEHEPVIPAQCDRIDVVIGLSAIGKTLRETAHRLEKVMEVTGLSEEHVLTASDLQNIVMEGYVNPLRHKYPNSRVQVRPGQGNTPLEHQIAEYLREERQMPEEFDK